MKTYEIYLGEKLCASQVHIADSFMTRFKGLMFRERLFPGEGLLLMNCPDIHCCFMRFTIDVIYLDRNMKVVGKETVKPWRLGKHFSGTKHVLELEEGAGACICPGDVLVIKEREIQ